MELNDNVRLAAQWMGQADGLLITAGAGMGVDSGLPDFRGGAGLWKAYPALRQANLSFTEIANPSAFVSAPHLAWGFYGHRLQLYRDTVPHAGFGILKKMAARMSHGPFVFTSNVDGQFQKAGFDEARIVECHGSIHFQQCCKVCNVNIWPSTNIVADVDTEQCLLRSPLPRCPQCGGLSRPNILMFNDHTWRSARTDRQVDRMENWLAKVEHLVVLELGAGTDIPTVRNQGERLQVPLVRINPRDFGVRSKLSVGLPLGSLEGLQLTFDEFVVVRANGNRNDEGFTEFQQPLLKSAVKAPN
jgi:NAD-dependent SIR2 family protein deacetylase